jgi:hypothetical protein
MSLGDDSPGLPTYPNLVTFHPIPFYVKACCGFGGFPRIEKGSNGRKVKGPALYAILSSAPRIELDRAQDSQVQAPTQVMKTQISQIGGIPIRILIALMALGLCGANHAGPKPLSYVIPAEIELNNSHYAVSHIETNVVIALIRTGEYRESASVDFATRAGTAVEGVDYTEIRRVIIFPAGQSYQEISIPIHATNGPGEEKTILLEISNPSPNALITRASATLVIEYHAEEEPPRLHIKAGPRNTLELFWSADCADFVLEKSQDPTADSWQRVEAVPITRGEFSVILEPLSGAKNFYRLTRIATAP